MRTFVTHNVEDLEAYYGRALTELRSISEVVTNPGDRDLTTAELLGPFRGEPAVDRTALVDALRGVAACALDDDDIASIDVNPLIVRDGTPIAVDALVVYGDQGDERAGRNERAGR